jgi:hypothetical protein
VLAPILTKTWNISPNLRHSFVSLADMTGWFFYTNKTAMLAAGWTVKFTCNGTTGPSGAGDTTDRWLSEADADTRATIAGASQSYAVLQNTDGLQVLFTFQGASDDIGRISYSPGGLYTLAGNTTFQPTASDEVAFSVGSTLVNGTTSSDRVMTIWCSTDTKQWFLAICRQGILVCYLGVERIIPYAAPAVFAVPYVGFRYTGMLIQNNPAAGTGYTPGGIINNTAHNAANFAGCAARVFTAAAFRIIRCGSGAINMCSFPDTFTRTLNDRFFNAGYPALQGSLSAPLYPFFWMGEKSANCDGVLGSPIDWWFCHTSVGTFPGYSNNLPGYDVGDDPNTDPIRSNWFMSLGSECVRPWRDAAPSMLTF